MVCIFGEKYSTSLCLVFGTMEFVWFYTGEILLTFGGTTLVKGMFYQRFDAECLTLLLWHLMTPQLVKFYWRYGISKFTPYSDRVFCNSQTISWHFTVDCSFDP